MTRRSGLVWKMAQRNTQKLPDCPPYLSEPAYAELMFGLDCHVSICAHGSFGGLKIPYSIVAVLRISASSGISIFAAAGAVDLFCRFLFRS